MREGSRTGRRVALIVLLIVLALANVTLDFAALSIGGGYLLVRVVGNLIPVSSSIQIDSVAMTGNSSGWAAGWGFGKIDSVLLRDSGGHWATQPLPSGLRGAEPVTLAMDSPQDGWMIAGFSLPDPSGSGLLGPAAKLLHYHDGQWRVVGAPLADGLDALTLRTASDGWAVGGGVILHWNGARWAQTPLPADIPRYDLPLLNAVSAPSASEAWAAGILGAMWHWDGARWSQVPLSTQLSAHAPPPIDHDLMSPDITGLAMTAPGEGWAVGSVFTHDPQNGLQRIGEMLECHAGIWRIAQTLPGVVPEALALDAHGDGWMVGDHGVIFRLRDGRWVQVTSPTISMLSSVSIAPGGEAWAGGIAGALLHEQHGVWSVVSDIDWSKASSQRAS